MKVDRARSTLPRPPPEQGQEDERVAAQDPPSSHSDSSPDPAGREANGGPHDIKQKDSREDPQGGVATPIAAEIRTSATVRPKTLARRGL